MHEAHFTYRLMQRGDRPGDPDGVIAQSDDRDTLLASITPDVEDEWYVVRTEGEEV